MSAEYDISVIVTAHNEGRLAHHALRSILRAIDYGKDFGITTEIIVILDSADQKTSDYFSGHPHESIKVEHTSFGDPGLARNFGVALASGRYAAFLDADDLFSRTWLKSAFDEAEKTKGDCVFHPEYVVCFGSMNLIAKPKSVNDDDFNPKNLIRYNYWNSVHFLARSTLLHENPFVATPRDSGLGFEDWHWHCEILAKGIPIITVPKTVVFYRKKDQDSRLTSHESESVLIPPTKLFEPETFAAVIERCKTRKGMQK